MISMKQNTQQALKYFDQIILIMLKQFECKKLKDGLYVANRIAAFDYNFIVCNKFHYIVNCTTELPNLYEDHGVNYLKFKVSQQKPKKIWEKGFKKIQKLNNFIEAAQQNAVCCLIHSNNGDNRCLVFAIAHLMSRFHWTLRKTLQFMRSKQIFIGLSENFIEQLARLEVVLSKDCAQSSGWSPPYFDEEDELIAKTYLNAQKPKQAKVVLPMEQKVERNKRVTWLDKLLKEKKKELELAKKKSSKEEQDNHLQVSPMSNKRQQRATEQLIAKEMRDSKTSKHSKKLKDLSGTKEIMNKKQKNAGKDKKTLVNSSVQREKFAQKFQKKFKIQESHEYDEVNEDNLNSRRSQSTRNQVPLFGAVKIKENQLKSNKQAQKNNSDKIQLHQTDSNDVDESKEQKIYKVTINNYINPSINFLNNQKINEKPKGNKKNQKKEKFMRNFSEKQSFKNPNAISKDECLLKPFQEKQFMANQKIDRRISKSTKAQNHF